MSEAKALGNHIQILSGFPFPSSGFTNEPNGQPIIRIRDLQQQNPETYFTGDYDHVFLISKGDILVGMDGDFNAIKWQGPPSLLNQRVCKITTKDSEILDQGFLYHSLQPHLARIHKGTAQTTVKHLSTKDLYGIDAELPPLPEQKKIAEILSSIDILIDRKKFLMQKSERIQRSLSLSLLHLGANRLGGESEQRALGEVLTLSRGVDITKATAKPGPFPVVSSSGISGWHDSFTAESGVVVGRKGSIGNVHFIETKHWVHDTSLGVIDYKGNSKRFVYHLLKSMDLAQYGTKSGSPSLNRNDLHPLPVRCPPLSQQEKIASILDGGDEKVRKLQFEIETLGNLKTAISQDLLSGRKRVSV